MTMTAPSKPTLAYYSDTLPKGDNATTYANPALTGTAPPLTDVLVKEGNRTLGGGVSGADGVWTVRSVSLAFGVHAVYAVTVSSDGLEESPPSPVYEFTILGTASPPGAPVAALTRQVTLSWKEPATGGSPIVGYKVYRGTSEADMVLWSTLPNTRAYVDLSAPLNAVYQVSAYNLVGEGPRSPLLRQA